MEANEVGHELPSLGVWRLRICNERGFERCLRALPFFTLVLPVVLWFGLSDRRISRNLRSWRPTARFLGAFDEPVSQEKRGEAVVPIVVAQIVQERALAGLTKAVIDNKAIAPGRNRRGASGHVEALKVLDRIARLTDPHALAHHAIEIHHAVCAQNLIHRRLRSRVHGSQATERRLFVGCVMIKMCAGRTGEPRH